MVILDLFLCFRATTNSKIPIHNKLLQQSGDMPTGTVGGSGGGQLAPFDPHPSCCRGGRGVRHRLLSSQGGQVHRHQLHLRPDLCHVGYQPQLCYCPRSKQCALFRYKMWIRVYGCDIQDSPFLVRLYHQSKLFACKPLWNYCDCQVTCLPDEEVRRGVRSYSGSLPRPRTSAGRQVLRGSFHSGNITHLYKRVIT